MTEEIKRIIEDMDLVANYNKVPISYTQKQIKTLLDYITNLQQENEKLKYNARGQVNEYFKDKYADEVLKNAELKKENEFLKLNNPEQNIEHFRIVKENKRKIDNLRKENKRLKEKINTLKSNFEVEIDDCEDYKKWYRDYKSKCEKAMELLKLPIVYETHQENGERDELLKKIRQVKDILIGSDENE